MAVAVGLAVLLPPRSHVVAGVAPTCAVMIMCVKATSMSRVALALPCRECELQPPSVRQLKPRCPCLDHRGVTTTSAAFHSTCHTTGLQSKRRGGQRLSMDMAQEAPVKATDDVVSPQMVSCHSASLQRHISYCQC